MKSEEVIADLVDIKDAHEDDILWEKAQKHKVDNAIQHIKEQDELIEKMRLELIVRQENIYAQKERIAELEKGMWIDETR